MPALIGVIEILLIGLVFKYEPIAFCIMMDYAEQAKQHIRRVYSKADPESSQSIEDILEMQYQYMRRSTTMDASSTTFKRAVCGRKYRRATWTCFILNCFYQQTGINAINVYANRLLV